MKIKGLFFTILFVVMLTLSINVANAAGHPKETINTCDTPSEQISINADPNVDGSLEFDKAELRVTKGACVEITFYNKSPVIEHDFTIISDKSVNFDGIHIHLNNNKDGINGTDNQVGMFLMPDADITFEFYCSVTGHRDGGMFGDFIVGEGSAAPGFGIPIAVLGLFALIAIPRLRKRNEI